jgi:hypothetical protein
MENINNKRQSFKYTHLHLYQYQNRFQNRQKGSLLIGLIITMVILSSLGGAMVYTFSSSALDAVFGNYAQRAYYAAESGARYMMARYRRASTPITMAQFVALSGTVTLPNNSGQAAITITDSMNGATTDPSTFAAANTTVFVGGDLLVANATNFPQKNGFFKIGSTLLRYKSRQGNQLQVVTGQGPAGIPVTTATVVTAPKNQVSITSKGSFPLAGIFNMSRIVEYGWILSGGTGGTNSPPTKLSDNQSLVDNNPFGNSTDLGRFATETVGGGSAITVTNTTGGNAEAVLGYSGSTPNPILNAWTNAGNFLSYDVQIKIATGVWRSSSGTFSKTAGDDDSVERNGYIAGLTFRSTGTSPGQWKQYGLDFAKYSSDGHFQSTMNPTNIYNDWSSIGHYHRNDKVAYQGTYYICTENQCSPHDGHFVSDDWHQYNPPMILLWTRNSNQSSGDDHWLAYKLLEDEPTNGIVDDHGFLKDWSTLMLRVVEGVSLRFNSGTTGFLVGDIVTGATSGATGKVFKKIQTTSSQDVIILNNVTGTFTTGENISAPSRTTIANAESRPRENYIWAMFGDTDSQGAADTTAINDTRKANLRILNHSGIDETNINCYVHWPETNIAEWGKDIVENCPTPQTVKNDYFKLVAWDSRTLSLNKTSNGDATMLIMGTGMEAGAILRTSRWTTVAYTTEDFPYELGFHSLGNTATKTHFDDLAINFPGQTGGSTPYIPPIQQ